MVLSFTVTSHQVGPEAPLPPSSITVTPNVNLTSNQAAPVAMAQVVGLLDQLGVR